MASEDSQSRSSWPSSENTDVKIDSSMILELVRRMQSQGTDEISLGELVHVLLTISASNTKDLNADGFLDESMTSSISSTAPSPNYGHYPFGIDAAVLQTDSNSSDLSDHPVFSFKTPLKTFTAKTDGDLEADCPVKGKDKTHPLPPAVGAFGLQSGEAVPVPTFALGQSDHKAQVAALKKKGPSRNAKKKVYTAPAPVPSFSDSTMLPVSPPSHSSPTDTLDSPAAASKPFSAVSKISKESGYTSTQLPNEDVPLPPPLFEFPRGIDFTQEKGAFRDASLHTQFDKMNIDKAHQQQNTNKTAEIEIPIDVGLAKIAAQFANIKFSFPPPPPVIDQQPPPSGSSMFVFGSNSSTKSQTGSNPFSVGVGAKTDSIYTSSNAENLFVGFSGFDNIINGVSSMTVDPVSKFSRNISSDSSDVLNLNTVPGRAQANAPVLFNMGVGGGAEGSKSGKKPVPSKRRTTHHHRAGNENTNGTANYDGHVNSNGPVPATWAGPSEAMKSSLHSKKAVNVEGVVDTGVPQSVNSQDMKRAAPTSDEEIEPFGIAMETVEEQEDTKRMLAFAELLRSHGNNLFSSKSYEGAIDAFSKALDNAPPMWPARLTVMTNKAAALFILGRYPEVVLVCDETVALCRKQDSAAAESEFTNSATTLLKVFARKGRALLKLGNYPAAHAAFSEVLDSPRIHGTNQFSTKSDGSIKDEADMSRADEDAIRTDVKAGVKQLLLAKVMFNRLLMLESQTDFKQFSTTADDLLKLSPELRGAHCFKASALCKQQKWAEAKEFIENCVCSKPVSIQRMHSFPNCVIPVGDPSKLKWTYEKSRANTAAKSSNFNVNVHDIVNACLVFGGALSRLYLWALKNDKHSRFLCAETMEVINSILTSLKLKIFGSSSGSHDDWKWVKDDQHKLAQMIAVKNKADSRFRAGDFADALNSYREFVKMDPDANLWNAVMYGNKAATLMRLSMHAEAVLDCHHSISKDPEYFRSYLRRARARKSLGEYDAAIADYNRYLSAPKEDPGISTADRQSASDELNEVQKAIEKQKNDAEVAARIKEAREAAAAYEDMCVEPEDSDDDKFTTFSYRSHGKATSDNPKSTYSNYHSRSHQQNAYNRFGGGDRTSYAQKAEQKRTDPPKPTSKAHATRGSTATGGAAGSNPHGSSYRHRAWENDSGPASADFVAKIEKSHYTVLGVSHNATEKEIKTAYRQMALKYHPDKNKNAGAEDTFKDVTAAYSVLADKTLRRTYDYNLRFR